jgi:hypothetical protein
MTYASESCVLTGVAVLMAVVTTKRKKGTMEETRNKRNEKKTIIYVYATFSILFLEGMETNKKKEKEKERGPFAPGIASCLIIHRPSTVHPQVLQQVLPQVHLSAPLTPPPSSPSLKPCAHLLAQPRHHQSAQQRDNGHPCRYSQRDFLTRRASSPCPVAAPTTPCCCCCDCPPAVAPAPPKSRFTGAAPAAET